MSNKRTIKRIIVFAAWLLAIGAVATLLVAANKRQQDHVCKKVVINIGGSDSRFFVEEKDVRAQMEKTTGGALEGRLARNIPLALLEKRLEANAWIRDAELYFDREDVLHVAISEREPIARIFTVSGNSFYIDSSGHHMPLLDKVSARVPVVTGFTDDRKWTASDSAVLNGVRQIATYVFNNKFWNEQIGEINVTSGGSFELTPTIGNQVIKIGDASDLEDKLNRLKLFYKRVLCKTGFGKYSVLDVEYAGQVVAVNKMTVPAVDSIQLQKNIDELLHKSTIQNLDEDMLPAKPVTAAGADSVRGSKTGESPKSENPTPNPVESKPRSVAAAGNSGHQPVEKPKPLTKMGKKPKALMPKQKHA